MGEAVAAEAETDDGGEGFGPAVGFGAGRVVEARGAAEADEDGVAGLHADEGAVGVVDGTVDEARDEAAGQHEDGGVGGVYFRGEVESEAVEGGSP